MKHAVALLGAALIALAPAALSAPATVPAPTLAPVPATATKAPVATVATAPANPVARANGASGSDSVRVLVAASQEATIFSQNIGRIRSLDASLGSSFTEGQVLVSFACEEQAARVRMAQAEVSSARQTHNAKVRLQGLQSAGELEVGLAASDAEKAQAELNLYRAQQSYCTVKAPFAGRVVQLHAKAHEVINAGDPLLDAVSDGPLKLRLNVPSSWLVGLATGQSFEVRIDETGKRYQAKISAINGRVDAVSQSIEIEGLIAEKSPDLLPGMSGVASFSRPR